ncbi:MAG: hypothetical protein ACPF8V_02470 [Luteibaculum sp.]
MIQKFLLIPFIALGIFGMLILSSCKKEREGCTDPSAMNYNPEADKENNSCDYSTSFTLSSGTFKNLAKTFVTITDRGNGIGNITLDPSKIWVLNGNVFVNEGQILEILPGTIVLAQENAKLIVARGARIDAQGTLENPIIFTHANDTKLDYDLQQKGKWGGIVLLGEAPLKAVGSESIFDLPEGADSRLQYGGNNPSDSSGTLTYVSIRHGGGSIAGLNIAGVGSGTTLNHIEVISTNADGIAFYGGTARLKHAVVSFANGHCYSFRNGFHGMGQFWISVKDLNGGLNGADHADGVFLGMNQQPQTPAIYNCTFLGGGVQNNQKALSFYEGAGAKYYNSIFVDWSLGAMMEKTIEESSSDLFYSSHLEIANNSFYQVANGSISRMYELQIGLGISPNDSLTTIEDFRDSFQSKNNSTANPGVNRAGITANNGLNVRLAPDNGFYTPQVSTRGAVSESLWFKGWTKTDEEEIIR